MQCMKGKLGYSQHGSPIVMEFFCSTDRRLDQTPLLIPPPLPIPLLIPFLRWIITVFMFLICPKLLTNMFKGPLLSGRRNTLAVSSLSLIMPTSRLGRKKYCRKLYFPCAVRARWWKRPYTESPSFHPEEALVGPWLWDWGWDSDCSICREASVSAFTNLQI